MYLNQCCGFFIIFFPDPATNLLSSGSGSFTCDLRIFENLPFSISHYSPESSGLKIELKFLFIFYLILAGSGSGTNNSVSESKKKLLIRPDPYPQHWPKPYYSLPVTVSLLQDNWPRIKALRAKKMPTAFGSRRPRTPCEGLTPRSWRRNSSCARRSKTRR